VTGVPPSSTTDPDQPAAPPPPPELGATALPDGGVRFVVWAPLVDRIEVVDADGEVLTTLASRPRGYHAGVLTEAGPGLRYRYRLHRTDPDGQALDPVDRADPASRWQPEGLHGPSAVDDPSFAWSDDTWHNRPLREQVLYELHVGTFTPEGTFDAAIGRLADLRELGITTIELMPVWQFPGERNWGYDGVLPYAVQHSYGGPAGLRRLVDAAHAHGIAVVLDVVYNHYGPEGNHLPEFGPYLTDRYDTPWGQAVNVDGPHSDEVRRYVVDNAVRWVRDFHLDGLRLDAVHAIVDQSAVHLLEELATAVHAEAERLGRTVHLIAESDLADPRLVRSPELGGYGLDAQWLDDVHHALHTAVTGERDGYYGDYDGFSDLARALRDRFVYAGRHSPHRERRIGRPARDLPYDRFVVCTQNHDQVGNRMLGERRSVLVPFETLKLAAGTVALLPFTPMLWMGQEYGEEAPFQYFVSHTDPDLIEAVRTGRRREFAYFAKDGLEAPDPQAEATFARSKLDWGLRDQGHHATILALYRELFRLRREVPALAGADADEAVPTLHGPGTLSFRRARHGRPDEAVLVVLHADDAPTTVTVTTEGRYEVLLDTAAPRWDGPGAATLQHRDHHLEIELGSPSGLLLRRVG
jgi:maltooligosyltrehalose trehalohydrolase